MLAQDPMSRVACETAITTDLVLVMGEITSNATVDIEAIVRDTICKIGYDDVAKGFDGKPARLKLHWINSLPTSQWASTKHWKRS